MRRWALAAAVLCAAPALATAGHLDLGDRTLRLDLTSTTTAGWRSGPQGYGEIVERLNLGTGTGPWSLRLRLDSSTYLSESSPLVTDRYTLEKIAASWTGRVVEVTAGDSYLSLGRGLALSLRKVDELGADTTLRGAKILVSGDDFGATVAVGVANVQNVDEATGLSVDDPLDLIAASELHLRIDDRATVGVHGAAIAFRDGIGLAPVDRYRDRALHVGATLDATGLVDRVRFYLEGVGQVLDGPSMDTEGLGLGLYATATADLGQVVLLFEGKAYGDLAPLRPQLGRPEFAAIAYNQLPTVERVTQIIENPQRDIAGGRLRADWIVAPELLFYLNYGAFRDWHGYDDPGMVGVRRAGTIHDPYAGVETRWNGGRSWAIASLGWRGVVLDGALARSDAHTDLDFNQSVRDGWSLTLHALHVERRKHESPILRQRSREGTVLAGVRVGTHLSLALGYDYTTDPTQPRRDYLSGSAQWDITPSSSLRLLAGSTRGGLRCISGVCRVFPAFEGARVTATVRY